MSTRLLIFDKDVNIYFVYYYYFYYYLVRGDRGPKPVAHLTFIRVPDDEVLLRLLGAKRVHPTGIMACKIYQVGSATLKLTSSLEVEDTISDCC